MNGKLLNEYRKQRGNGIKPGLAISRARYALETGNTSCVGYTSFIPAATIGAPFKVGGDFCRWIETPDQYGLRFVGYAQHIAPRSIRHTGWFLDDEGMGEKAQGVVYRMPSRKGRALLVAGIADPYNDGPAIVSFDTTDDETTAALWADQLAERYAEAQRDFQRVISARARFDDLGDEISGERKQCLALIAELKPRMRSFGPATCKALRGAVADLLESIGRARQERADIRDAFASHAAWDV
ncbi:hypothetical protein BRAO375_3660059 [Bradyrhizobium sp. ORS 375]|uniref:hypothetical protein n=1 Tax=Bradyrhizobium sp. (strain ORS 375) TaxID=566679 RepID=UPI000240699B|nr:hypothetical protein [Bradyrhizobium sp. ORS 375]CCD94665.1 hypothetical protein BRAO375_3660059 [Bradyrhizobium sp. ORS 375]